MLRMPEHSRALADATGENFLDLCESYELAWAGLNHWSRAPSDRGEQLKEYQDLIGALEAEVLNLIQQFR